MIRRVLASLAIALLVAAPVAAQPGPTFVMLNGAPLVDPAQPTHLLVAGWALKCQGTILGVHTYLRAVGSRTWQGWTRDPVIFYPRPDVAFHFMSDAVMAAGYGCASPTEYSGFTVTIDTSQPDPLAQRWLVPGPYDLFVCVEDSAGGRGWLSACTALLRFQYELPAADASAVGRVK